MERVFELIDQRHGGSVTWLESHGLERSTLDQLRARLAPLAASGEGGAGARGRDECLEPGELGPELVDQRRLA
jgi:hypothetical protein